MRMAVHYWDNISRTKPWLEGFAAVGALELTNHGELAARYGQKPLNSRYNWEPLGLVRNGSPIGRLRTPLTRMKAGTPMKRSELLWSMQRVKKKRRLPWLP